MTTPAPRTFASASEAYEAWQAENALNALNAFNATTEVVKGASQRSETDKPATNIEIRETFRRLHNHFQLFGFLTHASFDGFVSHVITPNVRAIPPHATNEMHAIKRNVV